jgi:hypothetical protein
MERGIYQTPLRVQHLFRGFLGTDGKKPVLQSKNQSCRATASFCFNNQETRQQRRPNFVPPFLCCLIDKDEKGRPTRASGWKMIEAIQAGERDRDRLLVFCDKP